MIKDSFVTFVNTGYRYLVTGFLNIFYRPDFAQRALNLTPCPKGMGTDLIPTPNPEGDR